MKRKIRLHYSTDIFPCELPRKLSSQQRESEIEESAETARNIDDDNRPLREVVSVIEDEPQSSEIINQQQQQQQRQEHSLESENREVKELEKVEESQPQIERSHSEMIAERLKTNPIQLLKNAKENQFGNFHSYYDHRCEKKWNDPRLRVLSRDWFLNKEVLDIGCNDGSFTMQIAIKYFPLKIQGIDIDQTLVSESITNLLFLEKQQAKVKKSTGQQQQQSQQVAARSNEKFAKKEEVELVAKQEDVETQSQKRKDKLSRLPKSFLIGQANQSQIEEEKPQVDVIEKKEEEQQRETSGEELKKGENNTGNTSEGIGNENVVILGVKQEINLQEVVEESKGVGKIEILKRFPENVRFRLENYVESTEVVERYDTICCFSTTKWIHLNFGDEGIIRLFDKVHKSLRDNGLFILEAQEWRSYKKKSNYLSEFRDVIKSIKLHPGQFKQHLISTYGYVLETEITPQVNTDKIQAFFKRPVLVFRKQEMPKVQIIEEEKVGGNVDESAQNNQEVAQKVD